MNFIAFRDTILRLEKLVNLIVVTSSREFELFFSTRNTEKEELLNKLG